MSAPYERINDLVYFLSTEVKLVFSVTLTSKSAKSGVRYPYHQEFEYLKNNEQAISIKREASAMLCFKILGTTSYDDICILPQHFINFYSNLVNAQKWFDGSLPVFSNNGNRLYIQRDNPNRKPILIRELVNNKWITIEPVVLIGENDSITTGVRMNFNNQITIDISVDRLYGLIHVLTGFNMYMAMSQLLTYVNTCTPGTNLKTAGTFEEKVVGVSGRQQTYKKSIFD